MKISTINYRETIFEHPDLNKITGVPTYKNLHLLHNEINANAMEVHSNLGDRQHGYLGLVFNLKAYELLTNTPFVSQVHKGNIIIPVAATPHSQEELKRQYDKNLQVFHKTRGMEQALIQKLVLTVEARYTIAMSNRTTDQFIGTLFMLTQYLIVTYRKISPSQLINIEQNTTSMQYDPHTPIDTVFN